MSKEKQIEEMFNIIVDGVIDGENNNGVPTGNTCANIAESLYNIGYRKQSEPISCGHERRICRCLEDKEDSDEEKGGGEG